jgi:hypothetical protein
MSGAAISILVFGIYLILGGLGFTIMPNMSLSLFGLPSTVEPWIRVMGWLMIVIGYFYIMSSRNDIRRFFFWTVYERIATFIIFLVFYMIGWTPWTILIFGTVDLIGAIWTYLAQRST